MTEITRTGSLKRDDADTLVHGHSLVILCLDDMPRISQRCLTVRSRVGAYASLYEPPILAPAAGSLANHCRGLTADLLKKPDFSIVWHRI